MGYETKFNLSYRWDEAPTEVEKLKLELALTKDSCYYGPLADFLDGQAHQCKWYEYKQDMKRFSKRFPKVLFRLDGEGEESGDLWREYFKAGKSQICMARITYDEYDQQKLEEIKDDA